MTIYRITLQILPRQAHIQIPAPNKRMQLTQYLACCGRSMNLRIMGMVVIEMEFLLPFVLPFVILVGFGSLVATMRRVAVALEEANRHMSSR